MKDLNKGKRMTQKKKFHLEEIIDEVVSSYKDDFTSDEHFIEYSKLRWICKKKKWFQIVEPNQTVVNDLIINNKEDVAEGQPKKDKDWIEQLMHEFFQEHNKEG